jgi:membrane protease YdiL (CAAX protease family)
MPSALPWDFVVILAVLAVVVPWRGAVRVRQLMQRESLAASDRLVLYASTIAFQWAATGVVLWRCVARGIRAQDLALVAARPWFVFGVALAFSVLITANQLASIRRLAALPPEKQGFLRAFSLKVMPQSAPERLAFFALVATVAICEEVLYRGFIQRVFENLGGGSILLGIVVSALFFSTAHLYQGRRGLVTTFVAGALFSVVRVWTGSLVPTIAAHFAADLSAGLLAPRWLAGAPLASPNNKLNSTRI